MAQEKVLISDINKTNENVSLGECFVIMPISDHEGYNEGHFTRIYKDIFTPAIEQANFVPFRADEEKGTNLIHLEIIRKLVECPMAICDLSTRNPNVLFELGIRQAFDMPVVLVQEIDTPRIFDISSIRCLEYRKDRIYDEVIEDQKCIADAIKETFNSAKSGHSVNSLIQLLSLGKPAKLKELKDEANNDLNIQYLISEIEALRQEFSSIRQDLKNVRRRTETDSCFKHDKRSILSADSIRSKELQRASDFMRNKDLQHTYMLGMEKLGYLRQKYENSIDRGIIDTDVSSEAFGYSNKYHHYYVEYGFQGFEDLANEFKEISSKADAILRSSTKKSS